MNDLRTVFKIDQIAERQIEIDRKDFVGEFVASHTKKIIDLEDEHIRKALISMGWRPPEERRH